jgi:hypothetical protein
MFGFGSSFLSGVAWCCLFGEYLLHRFVLHGGFAFHPAVIEHRRHHVGPFFAPWWIKIFIVVPLMLFFGWLASWLLIGHFVSPFAFALGLTLYYILFEALHYMMHFSAPTSRLGLVLRKHHFVHHFVRADRNFGFLLGVLFDFVFEGRIAPDVCEVSPNYKIDWLHDGKSIKPQFKGDFALKP